MDLLLVPYCKDRELNIFQWPPFLLASKVRTLDKHISDGTLLCFWTKGLLLFTEL
jgi:hypothetical protein